MPTFTCDWNAGSDSTGDGSAGNPWKSLSKALATIAGGDTVRLRAGTYAESTGGQGFLDVTRVFTSWVTVESESGNPADVVIQGASHASYNTLIESSAAKIEFRNVTFATRAATNDSACRLYRCTNIKLTGCAISINGSGGSPKGLHLEPGTGYTVSNVTVAGLTVTQTGGSGCTGIYVNKASGTLDTVSLSSCAVSVAGMGLRLEGGPTNVSATGGSFASTGQQAIKAGNSSLALDGVAATASAAGKAAILFTGASGGAAGGSLTDCTATAAYYALHLLTNVSGLAVTRGSFTSTGAGNKGIVVDGTTTLCANVSLTDVQAVALWDALAVNGCTNATVARGRFTSSAEHAVSFGVDGGTGLSTTGSLSGVELIGSGTGHALLLGNGSSGVAVTGCLIRGGDYGLVIKRCTGAVVRHCTLIGGTLSALYFKAAVDATAQYCTLIGGAGDVGVVLWDEDNITHEQFSGCSFTDNRVIARGSVGLLKWVLAGDGGGNVCDRNRYELRTSALHKFGEVRGANCNTLAGLRAAWAGYGGGSNDGASRWVRRRSGRVPLIAGG